ncbi:GntR family transcriptional regulator, histidine utilization repressor [Mesorhizobium albiziae]|uniref:Histidine utilization repressor n=2 Tax=Neomesorhizobium albiziae TaxID=335020 RepID=A0A1I4AY95_9HYPH|nr:histidine utilization repressor [Mesorhizobium albiziae]GLS34184.1 histidine utilization repressor [Mesorhizobium albiziae]SFK61592.1 GntR family transcriptional regulator, histidine utilization repressor [Mesorhizobium albiziae]
MSDMDTFREEGTASEPVSLYQRILGDIRDRILSGEWPPGYRIPFEHELTTQYGCSRMTVNKALSQLARAGLIERRRRSGSFVRQPQLQSAILEIHDIKAEVDALGLPYRYELALRNRRKATKTDLIRLDVLPGSPVLELSCRHFAGRPVFCIEDRLISLEAVPEAAEESFAETAPGSWLVDRVPWSAAENTIRATGADAATAGAMGIAPGTACLVIERKTWSADQPVTHVRLTYAGDSHALVARFTPPQG